MSRMRYRYITIALVCLFPLLLMSCSSNSGSAISGGTGTGNPPAGVASSVMMIADTAEEGEGLEKSIIESSGDVDSIISSLEVPVSPFPVFDEDSMEFTVDSAVITAGRIYFVTEDTPDTSLLDTLSSQLRYDNQGMYLEGPFVFDAIEGICGTAFDSLYLPEAAYKGLKLLSGGSAGEVEMDSDRPALRISGTFEHDDTERSFIIRLSWESLEEYLLETAPVQLSDKNESLFLLEFNARKWLDSVNFQGALSSGDIGFDENGDLLIEIDNRNGAVKGVEAQIRRNLLKSGSLRIFN